MIDLKISNNKTMQSEYQMINSEFYKELLGWVRTQDEYQLYKNAFNKYKELELLLGQLSQQQKCQWSNHIYLKIKQLFTTPTNRTTDELLQKLYLINKCAQRFKIPLEHKQLHNIIKQAYYDIYKDKIIPIFRKCRFDTQQFEVFEYQDPWYSRIWRAVTE